MGTLLNDNDLAFWDKTTQEVNCLAGTTALIFEFSETESQRDPIYGESTFRVHKKNDEGNDGIECPVLFKSPDTSPVSGEEGFRSEKHAVLFVARKDLDDLDLRRPKGGDIWKVWGRYYDVTKASASEGRVSDSGVTVEYEVSLVRRTKATPESQWMNPRPTPDSSAKD